MDTLSCWFYLCVSWAQNTILFLTHILWKCILILVIVFQQLQNDWGWFYTHLDFLVHFLFSVLEAGCFELFLIITNCLNTLSVGWSSLKRGFPQQPFPFSCIVKKSPKCHSQQSQIVPSSPNLTFLSQLGPLPCYISTNCSRHKNTLSRGHLDYKWAHMTFP